MMGRRGAFWPVCLVALLCILSWHTRPSLADNDALTAEQRVHMEESLGVYHYEHREYEGYDGWYNNLAHPDWGGSELPLTRRLPVAYADGVYAMAGKDRPNPIDISEATMRGATGKPSYLNRSAFMTFFGQQVVEEILDAQGAGCPPEYENIEIPEGHEYRDMTKDTKYGEVEYIPFLRTRYSFNTGYSPNVPREQLNEITPWIDGGLVYGTTKAWADALRSFKGGRLRDNSENVPGEEGYPEENTLGLPMANVPPPSEAYNHTLRNAKRYFRLGNPRGNENPFLLTFGILWFRWHNYWADKIYNQTMNERSEWNDERIFNEARKWVIATYQKIVLYDWLPGFLNLNETEIAQNAYDGYKSYVHPGITHEFQSAAMRFGHTMVPPGVYRRDENCNFFNTSLQSSNIWLEPGQERTYHHGVRTCNSFWNPQLPIRERSIESFLMGMASQVTEREDNIVTIDLQRRVFGPLEFSRRDLMAQNIQRGRDHGLPDYNTARESLGLPRIDNFTLINQPQYDGDESDVDEAVLKRLEAVYNGNSSLIDIWPGGLLETTANGPGPLFRKIILDQFIRTRDGDRFWFENEANGLFTRDQIEYIKNFTVYDVLILATDIKPDDIQKDPFHFTSGDKCWDMHPNPNRTIDENDMEECTQLYTFDYFEGSEVSYAISFLALGLFCLGVIGMLFFCARRRTKSIEEARRVTRQKTLKGKGPESLQKFAATEWCGYKSGTRPIQVALGPGKLIKVMNERGNKLYRTIDLNHHQKITLCVAPDGKRRFLLLHMEREYDLVLKFDGEDSRTEFISEVESFLGSSEVGLGRERQETREKELLKMAITKEHRQKTLERFFRVAFAQAFDQSVDATDISQLEGTDAKDVLNNELTKTEFAEMLSMAPNSLFVEQMFELVDKDQSGSLSFREFLDVIVIFAKGKPEDKLKLMFNMYDIDRSGHLSRDEFKTMLKSMMETVSASLEQQQLEDVISSMFKAAGFENKQELSLDDFIVLMGDHKEDLSQAALQLQGADVPEAAQPVERGATVIKRENAPSRARKTIVRAYADQDKQRPKTARNRYQSQVVKVETKSKTYTESRTQRKLNRFLRYIENNRLEIFYLVLYTLVLACVFIERAYYFSVEREHAGLRRIAGYGVTVTRGAASAMMFTYSCLLVTMCRNTITFLRGTFLHRYFPFDSMLFYHKYIAMQALLFSIIHIVGHALNFYHISTQTANDLTCLFRDFFHRSHELPKFHFWAYRTITGFTGILLTMVGAIMYTFAFQYARRKVFNLFWLTHNMYAFYFFLMIMHGSGNLVQPPFLYYFLLGPVILFTLDKMVSVSRKKAEITVVKAELLPSNVTMLEFKRPTTFEYKSGQWVRIACKTLNSSEYHPFTLSSAPHEENLSLHIRSVGPWTMNLRHTFDPNVVRDHPYPKLYLDGPYGEGHQDWYQFEVSVLVGGGIGVTPFASILKDLVARSAQGQKFTCKKVYFIWVTRTQRQFEWLTDIIRDVEDKDVNNLVNVHIFITQFFQKFDLRTTMLYICERHFQKISDRSLFTGLRSITHFGRPQFETFLQSLQDEHPAVSKIGVFSCGPPGMTNNVEKACTELNKYDGAAFIHHYENF